MLLHLNNLRKHGMMGILNEEPSEAPVLLLDLFDIYLYDIPDILFQIHVDYNI